MRIRDDFAGPGGWSQALKALGLSEVGVEFEETACATARAAGHLRIKADVRAVRDWDWGPMDGYIASPPCQTFSAAGSGAGRKHLDALIDAAHLVAKGETPEAAVRLVRDEALDERSILVLEPLLVIRDWRPTWVALEQVPQVLPIWQVYAEILRGWGYSVVTSYLQAEMFGVPQTRKRAILMAHLEREVALPTPTHSRYYSRSPEKLDPGVEKWVSMAEALGWGMTRRPSMTVTGGGAATGGAEPFGNASRQGMRREMEAGRWTHMGDVYNSKGCVRSVDEPAPTMTSSMDNGNFRWHTREPVPAIEGETVDDVQWVHDRPSPTIVGSYHPEVVAKPGYRKAGDPSRQNTPGSVRVSVEEAGILQSFPADYPWQGTNTKRFQQVGNAIPPGLAHAVLRTLLGRDS